MDVDQIGLDLGARIGVVLRRYWPLFIRASWEDAAAALALDLAFDLDNPFVQTVLGTLAEEIVRVAETTRDEIRALVGRQAAEGWSTERLAEEIRARGEIASTTRARLIAQTETAAAYSRGSIAAYQVSGVVARVEWLTADSPCPICDPLDGTTVPLGGAWPGGIEAPPAHPGCRCAIAPIVRRS